MYQKMNMSCQALILSTGLHINGFHIKPHRTLAPAHAVPPLEKQHVEQLHLDEILTP